MKQQTYKKMRQSHRKAILMTCLLFYSLQARIIAEAAAPTIHPQQRNQRAKIDLTIKSDTFSGMGMPNSPVKFSVRLVNRSEGTVMGTLKWSINSTAVPQRKIPDEAIQLGAEAIKEFTKTIKLPQKGFVEMVCEFQQKKTVKTIEKKIRVGCAPGKISEPLTKQDDFSIFWERSITELKAVSPEFQIIEQAQRSNEDIEVFEVLMRSHDNIRVRGWLEVPRKRAEPLPAVIRVPGYGQAMKPIGHCDDMIVFSFNPRGHGNSQEDVSGQPANFWIRGLDNAENYYYLGSYLDCLRAVDFIASRQDVDQDKIAVWGGSQGGGFAFATAALDSRIDFCIADIPFLCDWSNYFRLSHWPEMDEWIDAQPQRTWESTLRTLSYFDTMNLADRIHCRTLMSVGLQDGVCPPTTCFNTFNRIPGEKQYKIYPDKRHGLGREHSDWIWTKLRQAFHSNN